MPDDARPDDDPLRHASADAAFGAVFGSAAPPDPEAAPEPMPREAPVAAPSGRLARRIEGWLRRLPLGPGRSVRTLRDEALVTRVARVVEEGRRFRGVQVYAAEGVVTLLGAVPTRRDAEALVNRTVRVPGVVEVVDKLQIAHDALGLDDAR